jgi:hypothetical protein
MMSDCEVQFQFSRSFKRQFSHLPSARRDD